MIWREIKATGEIFELAPQIWRYEQGPSMPRIFRDASKIWTRDLAAFVRFIEGCSDVFGFYEGERFVGCVYFEPMAENVVHVHFSAVGKPDKEAFVAACLDLRDKYFARGVRIIRGWVLRRNHALRRIIDGVGLRSTGLKMDYGDSRGKVLTWELFAVGATGQRISDGGRHARPS